VSRPWLSAHLVSIEHHQLLDSLAGAGIDHSRCFRWRFLSVSGAFGRFEHGAEADTHQPEIDIEHGGKAPEVIHQVSG
jgi:hypothetical protein